MKKYTSARAFRTALELRLQRHAQEHGIDLQRLRQHVSFDRLLARLFSGHPLPWILKGGYAMALNFSNARGTKDIDLAIQEKKLFSEDPHERNKVLHEKLVEKAQINFKDYFEYEISTPILELNNAPEGGSRFSIKAKMDGRMFARFKLDIGIGDTWIKPLEKVKTPDWLGFAGIPLVEVSTISKEQQFAEKIHAYTLPRDNRPNSRVKDLLDMLLLMEFKKLDLRKMVHAIQETFRMRKTHTFPKELSPPPDHWNTRFSELTKECGLAVNIENAFASLEAFIKKLPL